MILHLPANFRLLRNVLFSGESVSVRVGHYPNKMRVKEVFNTKHSILRFFPKLVVSPFQFVGIGLLIARNISDMIVVKRLCTVYMAAK